MFSETAELYDLIYARFKSYEAEAARIAALLKEVHPRARALLDVACGTGEHARLLSERYDYQVDGVDLNTDFLRIAQEKNPHASFRQADMVDLDLGRRYDAVLCLFSSIGYLRTLENVRRALVRFRAHLAEDGLVLVEPWYTPPEIVPDRVFLNTAESGELKVCRMSHTEVEDRLSRLTFEYLIGRSEGIRHAREVHELGLFTVEELLECFAAAGLSAEYDADGLSGRGLYIARAGE